MRKSAKKHTTKRAAKKNQRGTTVARKKSLKALALRLKDGDILVFRGGGDVISDGEGAFLKKWLTKTGRPNSLILRLGPETKIEHLNPDAMKDHGWIRDPDHKSPADDDAPEDSE